MPNGHLAILPTRIKTGLLASQIRDSGLTIEEFIDYLWETGMTYTVLVYEAEPDEGGFWATVAELPGCTTSGETIEEIEENIKDAIKPTWMP